MLNLRLIGAIIYWAASLLFGMASAFPEEITTASELTKHVIEAAGGEAKLLKLFRMKEQYNAGTTLKDPGTPRTSVVEPPKSWWIGTTERGTEPAKISTWAWTLGALTDPESKIEMIANVTEGEASVPGLRVSGSVDPPIDLYFDADAFRLVRLDWRDDIYRFSEWKDYDGTRYPCKCTMFRRKTNEPWFFHEILELERLQELPTALKR